MGVMPAVLVAVLGGTHLLAHYAGLESLRRVTKGLPIVVLLAAVLADPAPVGESYRRLVAAGLACSLAGDLFLLSREQFRAGLASFFVAHVL